MTSHPGPCARILCVTDDPEFARSTVVEPIRSHLRFAHVSGRTICPCGEPHRLDDGFDIRLFAGARALASHSPSRDGSLDIGIDRDAPSELAFAHVVASDAAEAVRHLIEGLVIEGLIGYSIDVLTAFFSAPRVFDFATARGNTLDATLTRRLLDALPPSDRRGDVHVGMSVGTDVTLLQLLGTSEMVYDSFHDSFNFAYYATMAGEQNVWLSATAARR